MLGIGHAHTINYSGSGTDQAVAFRAVALSNVAKTHGESSSYLTSSPLLKSQLETAAGSDVDPLLQINIRQPRDKRIRRRS